MTKIVRVFQLGNSQAIRLPKEFRLDVDSLEITREGDALVLRPHASPQPRWSSLRAAMARGLSEDFTVGDDAPDSQVRAALDDIFK